MDYPLFYFSGHRIGRGSLLVIAQPVSGTPASWLRQDYHTPCQHVVPLAQAIRVDT